MDTANFCVLCGGPFDLEDGIYKIGPQNPAYQWLYDVQVLGTHNAFRNSRFMGAADALYNAHSRRLESMPGTDVLLSEIVRWKRPHTSLLYIGDTMYEVLTDHEDGHMLFPLHAACIRIGCRSVRSYNRRNSMPVSPMDMSQLYHMLQRRFLHQKYFGGLMGNDILGLHTDFLAYGPRSALAVDTLGWWGSSHEKFLTDPISEVEPLWIHGIFLNTIPSPRVPLQVPAAHNLASPLENLPTELLEEVLGHLDAWSVISLHYSSRTLFHRVALDENFWRNRLKDESFFPHIWEVKHYNLVAFEWLRRSTIEPDFRANWEGIFKGLFRKDFTICEKDHRFQEIPPGYWNRCRIWRIVQELCAASETL